MFVCGVLALGLGFPVGDVLARDWPRLEGQWATTFAPSPDGSHEARRRFDLSKENGEVRLDHYAEVKVNGETRQESLHSAVLVVTGVRVREGKTYLVVRPKGQPAKFETEIRYELADGQLKLDGALGTARLTGAWTRLGGKKG
jgi:hypothetical protein